MTHTAEVGEENAGHYAAASRQSQLTWDRTCRRRHAVHGRGERRVAVDHALSGRATRDRRIRGGFQISQRGQQLVAHVVETRLVSDFAAVRIADVEDVEHLVVVRGNLGQIDGEIEAEQRFGERVQEAGAIVSEDVYFGAGVGRFV